MNLLEAIKSLPVKKVPEIKPGHTVRVHQRVKEGEKERIQIFEGLVIKTNSGSGADKTITVRKIVEGIGVEKIFPVYSPLIKKIELKKESKVRRAKLYYMRDLAGKSARLKGSFISGEENEEEVEKAVEELAEQKAHEEAENETAENVSEETPKEETPAQEPASEKQE